MQVHVLSLRFLRSWYRCPVNLAIQGAQYIFFAPGCQALLHAVSAAWAAFLGRSMPKDGAQAVQRLPPGAFGILRD